MVGRLWSFCPEWRPCPASPERLLVAWEAIRMPGLVRERPGPLAHPTSQKRLGFQGGGGGGAREGSFGICDRGLLWVRTSRSCFRDPAALFGIRGDSFKTSPGLLAPGRMGHAGCHQERSQAASAFPPGGRALSHGILIFLQNSPKVFVEFYLCRTLKKHVHGLMYFCLLVFSSKSQSSSYPHPCLP